MVVTSLVKEVLPKERKVFKYILIPLLVLFFLATVLFIVQDHRTSIDSKRRESEATIQTHADLDSLKRLYGPIAEIAKGKYPNLTDKNAILQLTARIEAAEKAANPAPLATRLRGLLEEIDPKIIPALKTGHTGFEGGITASQFTRLQTIANESGAKEYIRIDPGSVRMGIGMGPEGVTYNVAFKLNPKLLQQP